MRSAKLKRMQGLTLYMLSIAFLSFGCGKAEFAGRTDPAPETSVLMVLPNTDIYLEIGQEFSNEMSGKIDITDVRVFANTLWEGNNNIDFELRTSLVGDVGADNIGIGQSQPRGWARGTVVFNEALPGSGTTTNLQSNNLKLTANEIFEQGRFWILVRLRYTGLDINRTLTLSNVQVYAKGQKSLEALGPFIDLTF